MRPGVPTSERPFLTAEWRYLAMLQYAVDPHVLRPFVPRGTELDDWQGRMLVSLVGFQFLETRVLGVPIPFHRHFDEVNLRFYVRRRGPEGWRRAVVFLREIVPRLEAEGLLATIPQRGMQIAHIDINLIREAFQFRLFMEREAVALFTVNASDAVLAGLRREHEDMLAQALSQAPTPEMEAKAQNIDWAMHDTFIDALGNEIIKRQSNMARWI